MPTTNKLCSYPMCNKIQKESRCAEHRAKQRGSFTEKGSVQEKFYHSTRWRKLRKYYITKNPLCVECKEKGRDEPARVVDHIISIRDNYSLRTKESNLQSLCTSHHNSKSALSRKNRGGML